MAQHEQGGSDGGKLGIVVIGRNEGARLVRCLESLPDGVARVYVDSASSDDSVAMTRARGIDAIELNTPPRLSAARARNAGLAHLAARNPALEFVQMIDGDCEVQPGWLDAGIAALEADPGLALVFGRRRERYPDRSTYNALCDDEWDVAVGPATACGGDVLCRVAPLQAIGGYDPDMIAGEDPDMAVRLRGTGWRLARIDNEMTLHDAAILKFGQWWMRCKRAGHAFAELASRHPDLRAPDYRRSCRSIVIWAGVIPALFVAALLATVFASPIFALPAAALVLIWPAKMAQIALAKSRTLPPRLAIASGVFLMLGKFPELLGLLRFRRSRAGGQRSGLIEYKQAAGR
ncbi:glycosyl transferase [Sphingomonas sp. Leaf357]|uniref:glycosyltransferase n=1 Tax=Sphingomonas sp. Leaf357 TaxID=1736350 RepID=UPI00070023D2|nr:glycosyltransferase [Sphingomonas sp. Leaf357]KQS04182.1 glycosyl transferase [Sphingomonas sp. Leaf357]